MKTRQRDQNKVRFIYKYTMNTKNTSGGLLIADRWRRRLGWNLSKYFNVSWILIFMLVLVINLCLHWCDSELNICKFVCSSSSSWNGKQCYQHKATCSHVAVNNQQKKMPKEFPGSWRDVVNTWQVLQWNLSLQRRSASEAASHTPWLTFKLFACIV